MTADAEASLPTIIAAVRKHVDPSKSNTISARSKRHALANHEAVVKALEKALEERRMPEGESDLAQATGKANG